MTAHRARPHLQPRPETLKLGRFELRLDRPLLMGVVNVTPDSFFDGGKFLDPRDAVARSRRLIDEGADILDIGGESSRPGAQPISEQHELRRILPVLKALKDIPVSVDTRHPAVMRAVLAEGASMINDIEALTAPGALDAVAASDCGVCLMHKKGDPATMQQEPRYGDVVGEVGVVLPGCIDMTDPPGDRHDSPLAIRENTLARGTTRSHSQEPWIVANNEEVRRPATIVATSWNLSTSELVGYAE